MWIKVPWTQQPPPGTPLRKDGIFNRAKWFAHFGRGHPFEEKLQEKGTFDTNAGPVVTSDIGLVGEFPTASLDGSCDFVKHDDIHVGVTEMTLCVWAKNRKATKLTGSSESAASYTGTGNDPWDVRWGVDEDVDFLVEADSGNTTYQDNIVNALGVAQGGEDSQTWNMLGGTWSNDLLVARCNRQKGAGTATVGANTGDASATNNPRLGGRQAGQTNSWDGWILYGLWFDVDIGDAAWLAILENKWSVYEPRTVWVPTSLPAPGPAPAGFIDIKVPWTQQPPAGTKINKGHELARDLIFFTPCNEGGGDVIDNVTGARGSDVSDGTSTAVREANEYGRHVELFRGGDTEIAGYEFTSRAEWELNAQALTVIGHVKRTAAVPTSGSRVITKGSDAFSTGWGIVIPDDTSVRFNCRVGGGNSNAVATTGSNLDRDLFVAGRYDGTNITAFGRIGRSHSVNTADTADTGNINLDTNPLALGHLQGARRALTGNIYFTGVWERVLENTEIQSIWDNPWQIYEPRIIRIPVGIAAPIPDSAFIDRKIPWTRQPPPGTQLNKAHPLYNYIAYVQNFASINGPDGVGNLSPTIVDQTQGPGYLSTTGSAGDYYDTNFVPSVSNLTAPTNKVSTMMLARTTDVSGALWSYRDGATVVAQSAIDGTGWRLQSGGDTLTLDATTTEAADGEWHVLGTSLEVGTDGAGFIDGKIGSGGRVTSTSNGSDAAVNLAIGNRWQAYPTTGFESALDCQLFVMFVGISLSDVQHRQLAENPWQIYEPLSIRIPVGIAAAAVGNQNIAVGLATETDLAQPLTGTFTVPVGLVTETDLAQPITGAFTVPVGLVTETDLAQPLTGTFTVPVGLATETDLAQPLTGTFTVPVGLVTETDLAQPIVVQQSQSISIGLASETDLAQPVTGTFTVPIGQALETDLAQPLTGAFTVPVGLVTETDLAQPVSINLDLPVGLASETDLAQPLTGDFTVPVGLVTETDLAQPIVPVQGLVVNVGLATETDLAQPLTGTFTVPVGLASETDLAQPLTGAFTVLIGQASETDLAQPVSINMALPVGLATETDLAQPLTGTFTVPVGLATETDLAQPISQVTLTKTATVTVIGGENLSNLSWVVFDGYDVSTDPILLQGAGESTDGAGELVINLDSTGVINGDPVSIVITDYTTSPTATNMAAVCYATVVVA